MEARRQLSKLDLLRLRSRCTESVAKPRLVTEKDGESKGT
jgi:hypothetical protein